MSWAALASEGFREELKREIEWRKIPVREEVGDLFLLEGEPQPLAWPRVVWFDTQEFEVLSISHAAKQLKPLARKWQHYSGAHHRRGTLIQEQLRPLKTKPLVFPTALPAPEAGVFTLLTPERMLVALRYDRPDPLGRLDFEVDKSAPSRAYLKLWEALTLGGAFPQPGDTCLDLGSHPGGWTWVLAKLGAGVVSVDRQALDPKVAAMPGVEFRGGDAFQVTPEKFGKVDWLFSDVICYPDKLFEFVKTWVDSGCARRMICTIKIQGAADPAVVARFQEIGRVLHLHQNKHELTWFWVGGR